MKLNLEKLEKISVIIGVLLGVSAFFWQLYDTYDAKRAKVSIDVYFELVYEEENLQWLIGSIDVVNTGQQPIYIKYITIAERDSEGSGVVIADFEEENINAEPIQPGASRVYFLSEIDYLSVQESQSNLHNVILEVESPIRVLAQKNLNQCFADIIASIEGQSGNSRLGGQHVTNNIP